MATIQDVFSHIYTTEAHLGDVPVKYGQIILCTDSEKLYIDHGTTRVSTSDVVQVDNQEALPLAPLDKLYITKDTGDIFFYINGAWEKINQSDISVGAGLSGNGSSSSPLQLDIKNYSSTDNINLTSSNQVNVTGTNSISLLSNDNQSSIKISATGIVLNSHVGVTINSQGNALSFATGTNSSGERDIYLDNHSMNTAGGFAVVDLTTGKLPIGIIPDVTGNINIDNYTSNSTIRLTSTAGAVNLISNTGEVGLYSGSNVYVKALTDTVELKATTVSLNGHAQNTAGGFAIVDIETGKLPASIIPEQTNIDLSDAVLRYPATVDTESKVVTITDGTPVKDIRIGDEIVTAAGVYKKTKDSITTGSPADGTRIKVSGITKPAGANGVYIRTETEKVWKHESADYWISQWISLEGESYWLIANTSSPSNPGMAIFIGSGSSSGMPWEMSVWNGMNGSGSPVLENAPTEQTITDTLDLFEYASLSNEVVKSVNGKSGTVVLTANDVGAAEALHTHTISNVIGLRDKLDQFGSAGSFGGGLPTGTPQTPFLICSEVDRGNGLNCKFLLQPVTSSNQIVDSAAGNNSPCVVELSYFDGATVTVDDDGNIVCTGAYGYGNYAAIRIPANSLPNDILVPDHEWAIDLDFTANDVNSVQYLFGRADTNRFDIYIQNGNIGSGAWKDNWSPISAGRHLATVEYYYDDALASYIRAVYLDGEFKYKAAFTAANYRTMDFLIGNADSSNRNGLNGLIHGFRITNNAPHRGESFSPAARPWRKSEIGWSARSVDDVRKLCGTLSWNELTDKPTYLTVPVNTANGLVQLGSDGKIPTNLYEQAEGGLTSVNTGSATNTGLTGDGTASSPISLDLSNYGTGNAISLTSAGGFTFKIGTVAVMTLNTDANAHFATHTYLAENPEANVYFHGNATNTANGFVVLGADGKVPSSLLPEMSQSWTKVTINQSSFATSDDTYGGSYYELDGICSVEVYDADGYKVEFDVKCDFTNSKTRIYIPSGLTADTISNWTLLYLAKSIA